MSGKDKRVYQVSKRIHHFDGVRCEITGYNNFPCFRTSFNGYKQYLKDSNKIDFFNRYYDGEEEIEISKRIKRIPKKDCRERDSWNDITPKSWDELKSWKRRTKRKRQYTTNKSERYINEERVYNNPID